MKFKYYTNFLVFIWKYLKTEKKLVSIIILSIFLHSIFSVSLPLIIQTLVDNISFVYEKEILLWVLLAMIFVPTLSGALMVFEDYYANKLGHRVLTEMRIRLFSKHLKNNNLETHDITSGEKLQAIIDEPDEIGHWIYITSIQIILNFMSLIFILGILFYLDLGLGLLSIILLLLYMIPYIKYHKSIQEISYQELKWRTNITSVLSESLNAVSLFKAFGRTKYLQKKFENSNKIQSKLFLKASILDRKSKNIIGGIVAIGISIIYLYGGYRVLNGDLTIGGLIAAKMYIETLFIRNQILFERVIETYKKIPISEQLEYNERQIPNDIERSKEIINPINKILFKNISIAYENKMILKGLTLEIPIGKYTAIIGESGSGKTSLLKLLFGISTPINGDVFINDDSIRTIKLTSIRSKIQLVAQTPEFLNISILDNITFGVDKIDPLYLKYLLEKFNIDEFVKKLPKQYETIVGRHGGVKLSGGQLQRLAIVRALIRKPEVLLMDEVGAGLDLKNLLIIREALSEIKGLTIISVTHNLEEALSADNLFDILDHNKLKKQEFSFTHS